MEMNRTTTDDDITALEMTGLQRQVTQNRAYSRTTDDKSVRHRWHTTICLCMCSLGMGLVGAVAGATLIHIGQLYNATTGGMSIAVTIESAGCLLGAFVYNSPIQRVKFEFAIVCCVWLAAAATVLAPFVAVFPAFVAVVAVRGLASAVFTLISQAFIVDAWDCTRFKSMVTQAQNAVWSIGATVSPFVIKPFLIELVSSGDHLMIATTTSSLFYDNTTTSASRTINALAYNNSTSAGHRNGIASSARKIRDSTESAVTDLSDAIYSFATGLDSAAVAENPLPEEGLIKVRYAYVLIGILALLTVLPMMNLHFHANGLSIPFRQTLRREKQCAGSRNSDKFHSPLPMFPKPPTCPAVSYIVVVVLLGFLYGGLELTPRSFLPSFVVRRLSWSVGDAASILSVFYGTFCLGRLVAVPLSTVISTAALLVLNVFLAGIGFGLLLLLNFVPNVSPLVVWISSGIVGFGLSSTFASLILCVTDDRLNLGERCPLLATSAVLTALCAGCHVGCMVFPFAIGNLFDRLSPMWMVYIMTGATVLLAVILVVRQIFAQLLDKSMPRRILTFQSAGAPFSQRNIATFSA